LGPLGLREFALLQPGREAFAELVFLIKLYTHARLDFEIEFLLERADVKPLMLSALFNLNALGRSAWLGTPQEETVSVRIAPEGVY
jgi:predicted component of type VI protein secretion system